MSSEPPREPRIGDRIYFEGSQTTPSAEGTIKLVMRGHVYIKWDVGCANWVPRWLLSEDRWGWCDARDANRLKLDELRDRLDRAAPPKLFRPDRADRED